MKGIILATLLLAVIAKDPYQAWNGFFTGTNPAGADVGKLTKVVMSWKVPQAPTDQGCLYYIWPGIEGNTNENLIQPVLEWSGSAWSLLSWYIQWLPSLTTNTGPGNNFSLQPGQEIIGTMEYVESSNSYTCSYSYQGQSVAYQNIPIQSGVTYGIIYAVMERPCSCSQYSPDNEILFYDVYAEYDNVEVTPTWQWSTIQDLCGVTGTVNGTSLKITYNSQGQQFLE